MKKFLGLAVCAGVVAAFAVQPATSNLVQRTQAKAAPAVVGREAMFWLDANDAGAVGAELDVWHDHRGPGYFMAKRSLPVKPKVIAVEKGPLAGKKAVSFHSFGTRSDMDFTRQRVEEAFFVMEMDRPTDDSNFYLGDARQCMFHGGYKTGTFFFEAAQGRVAQCQISLDGQLIEKPLTTLMPEKGYHIYSWNAGPNTTPIYAGRITRDRDVAEQVGHHRYGGKRLCELILFNRVLTAEERRSIEAYLKAKWFAK